MENIPVPELVKSLYSLFGKKWGRWLGRAIVIALLIVVICGAIVGLRSVIGDAYMAIRSFASQSTIASRIILAIISTFISFAAMVAVAFSISLIITLPVRIGLAIRINSRIDKALSTLDFLIKEILNTQPKNMNVQQISTEITTLQKEWNTSRITRFTRWWLRIGNWATTKPREDS